jgi:flagellar biosynthesis/type III secretory pathway protein FliH
MRLSFGRVRGADEAELARPVVFSNEKAPAAARGRVLEKRIVDAALRAEQIVERARAEAERIANEGRARLQSLREEVIRDARAEVAADFASQVLRLAALEQRIDERAIDRLVEVSRLLAERLLGEALAIDPTRVTALARRALEEAHGARKIDIVAHPDDVPLLERALAEGALAHVAHVAADPARARGNLRLDTEIGMLDANLAPQLERLAQRLRETLRT